MSWFCQLCDNLWTLTGTSRVEWTLGLCPIVRCQCFLKWVSRSSTLEFTHPSITALACMHHALAGLLSVSHRHSPNLVYLRCQGTTQTAGVLSSPSQIDFYFLALQKQILYQISWLDWLYSTDCESRWIDYIKHQGPKKFQNPPTFCQ